MKTLIEVGANHGTDTETFLGKGFKAYAFEPTPELHLKLKEKFKGNENYYPVPLAVDLVNGWTWFNIAGQCDWGCSSIHTFNPNINNEWQGRTDFKATDRCRVMTMRLDTFIDLWGITEIDYLWIDAQGNDFRVLQSLGDKISMVKEGKCESALTVSLYDAVDNTTNSIKAWLEERGFSCRVVPDDANKEADVHFNRV